jgi:proteasome lid subunit RPN8/RPN11
MKKPQKSGATHPAVVMEAEVARRIRQHARSSMKAEVCGVLIGTEQGRTTSVAACIAGVNAAQGGAHVTFTQETWEHIYKIKDAEYPNERIVGWYHSHPGFGVFLSDHDTFIQENFFESPQQIAWVFDPHTDEEGCFGWHDGKIEKLDDVSFRYRAPMGGVVSPGESDDRSERQDEGYLPKKDWVDYVFKVANYALVLILGGVLAVWGSFYLGLAVPRQVVEQELRRIVMEVQLEMLRRQQAAATQQGQATEQTSKPDKENKGDPKKR